MKPRKSSRLQSTRKKKKNKQEPLYGRNKGAENRALFITPKLDELKNITEELSSDVAVNKD